MDTIDTCVSIAYYLNIFANDLTISRFIFLDTQPLMSHSLLDNIMYGDRSFMSEHLSPDTQIDIQSLQVNYTS